MQLINPTQSLFFLGAINTGNVNCPYIIDCAYPGCVVFSIISIAIEDCPYVLSVCTHGVVFNTITIGIVNCPICA